MSEKVIRELLDLIAVIRPKCDHHGEVIAARAFLARHDKEIGAWGGFDDDELVEVALRNPDTLEAAGYESVRPVRIVIPEGEKE